MDLIIECWSSNSTRLLTLITDKTEVTVLPQKLADLNMHILIDVLYVKETLYNSIGRIFLARLSKHYCVCVLFSRSTL